jgi:CBS domain containing-hemolysin-like protein
MPISEFNSEYGESLDDTDYTTIGGYVFGQLGRLPRPGDRVPAGSHTLEVVEMEGRRVKSLRLHGPEPDTKRESESPVAGRESRAS